MSGMIDPSLQGACVVLTRPAGQAAGALSRLRRLGAEAFNLPGSRLRAADNPDSARAALGAALAAEVTVFISPSSVRYASALLPPARFHSASLVAIGETSARALRGLGAREVNAPPLRQTSEGALALTQLREVAGRKIGIVGAPGGRGLLQSTLRARGAQILEAHVYQREPARLDAHHHASIEALEPRASYLLISSVESLDNLRAQLPQTLWQRLCACTSITSSARVDAACAEAGFNRRARADSARLTDLIEATLSAHAQGH